MRRKRPRNSMNSYPSSRKRVLRGLGILAAAMTAMFTARLCVSSQSSCVDSVAVVTQVFREVLNKVGD